MFVIIKNINSNINIDDLEGFVKPLLKGSFFQQNGTIKVIKIIRLVDKNRKLIERHGLVSVSPEHIKERLIKALNSRTINNQKYVAEYAFRHWWNDQRGSKPLSQDLPGNNRTADRRRSLKVVTESEKTFSEPVRKSFLKILFHFS